MVRKSRLVLLILLSVVVAFKILHQPVIGSYDFHETYNLSWGTVKADTIVKKTVIPEVVLKISSKVTPITKNRTAKAVVVHFKAFSKDGKTLWEYDSITPYLWKTIDDVIFRKSGFAEPLIMVSNTSSYLFIVEVHSAPREVPFVRRWVGEDWVYVFGERGLVKKLSLGKNPWPKRNVFISSAGNYTILGFEQPQGDGSPAYGRVLIFNGSEVIFDKTFPYDPNCLCYVIPGWGRINEEGYSTFGLYTGTGIYNGTFTYKKG